MARKTSLISENVIVDSSTHLRYTLRGAASQFGCSPESVRKKLIELGEEPDANQTFSTSQIIKVLFSDEKSERLRRTRAEANLFEARAAILKGEHLNKAALVEVMSAIVSAIKQIIEGSELGQERKSEILQNLADVQPAFDRVHKAQTRAELAPE